MENAICNLELQVLTKIYSAKKVTKKALAGVSFTLGPGLYGLLGPNGAGKSTMMNIITGNLDATSGKVLWNGKNVLRMGREFRRVLGYMPQQQNLYDSFTGRRFLLYIAALKEIPRSDAALQVQRVAELVHLSSELEKRLAAYSGGMKQRLLAAAALLGEPQILIMDEPTSSLSQSEVQVLFKIMRELNAQGISIVYISHRLEEIMEIGDHVTILRDGKYVDDAAVKDIDVPWIVQKMTGSNKSYPKKERDIDWEKQDTVLEVKDLCLPKKGGGWLLDHVSFKLKRGEILGIYGLMGAGRTEVFECLMGLHPEHTGEVYVDGKKIKIKNIAEQIKNGFALVPEDRQAEGLVQTLDIEKNISLSSLKTCCNKFVLSKQKEDEYVDAQIKDIHIKVADKHLPILSLSGGNQQKCVIGKGVLTDPKILLMDEPSRGIDICAKQEVFDIINQYADRGLSIICVSSELKEMLAIANRVVVLSNGIKTAEFTDDEITEDNLVLASYKGHH